MFKIEGGEEAYSFDLDDTIFRREKIIRYLGFIKGGLNRHKRSPYNINNLPNISFGPVDQPITGLVEKLSFKIHAQRSIIPETKDIIIEAASQGIDIYGNTGRSNKREWEIMTARSLENAGIAEYFRGVFHTPDGIKTAMSKAVALKLLLENYKQVSHFEDDYRTVLFLADLFPNIDIYFIQHALSGLLYSDNEPKNIHRIWKNINP